MPHVGGHYPAVPADDIPELASMDRRGFGCLFDLVTCVAMFVGVVAGGLFIATLIGTPNSRGNDDVAEPFAPVAFLTVLVALAAPFCYRWLTHAKSGKTVGKWLVGIRLVKETTGQPVGKRLSAARELVIVLLNSTCSVIGVILDLGWSYSDQKVQTLHDKAVGSIVIRE